LELEASDPCSAAPAGTSGPHSSDYDRTRMSVDLAVWDGPQPASDKEALKIFEQLYERYVERRDDAPPTERIAAYVDALLARYPDITEVEEDAEDTTPWNTGPLINEAAGPFIYFGMVTNSVAEEAHAYAVATARSMGLVYFDPQSCTLMR
jgi:hypothetical protein